MRAWLVGFTFPLLAQLPQPVVENKVKDRFVPAPYEAQKIEGYLGRRIQVNLEGRLLHVDEAGLLEGFQKRPGKQAWIGEHVGKYLDAASNTWALTRDERLRAQMDRTVNQLLPAQMPDGYLGTYLEKDRWASWDVWVHKYNLIGLLAYYRVTGDERALKAARGIGDLLAATFGEGKRDIIASSTHVGMAATSVLEPVVCLYRYTGEKRYLDFAEYIVRSWEQPNGPKIISSLLSQGRVDKTANGKAYEMMSDLVGLAELYRMTGKDEYRKAVAAAWEDIATRRLFVTGTTSNHEHFRGDGVFPGEMANDVGEGCATVTWLQLSSEMLRLTGEAKYAQELERTVFNQLLGAQDARTGNICYFTPLSGRKQPGPGINCCVSSEPRGISMIPAMVWGMLDGAPAIEMYTPGAWTASLPNGGKVKLEVLTEFPEHGEVTVAVTPEGAGNFPLQLRVPAWTEKFEVEVGKTKKKGTPGSYLTLAGPWKAGDVVKIRMDLTVATLDGGASYPGYVAFQRGPEVLVLERGPNPKDEVPYLERAAPNESFARYIGEEGSPYQIPGMVLRNGKKAKATLVLTPFAEAKDEYRVWLPKQVRTEPVAVSAFGRESISARDDTVLGSICDDRTDTWRATRAGAKEHWFAVTWAEPSRISRIAFRHAAAGGGAFAEAPRVEVMKAGAKEWEAIGTAPGYSGTGFDWRLQESMELTGVRVSGKPAGASVNCAELEAFE